MAHSPADSLACGRPFSPGRRLERLRNGRSKQNNERASAVREAISRLPPDLREALILFEYQDMSYDQIAKIQGCSAKLSKRGFTGRAEFFAKSSTDGSGAARAKRDL